MKRVLSERDASTTLSLSKIDDNQIINIITHTQYEGKCADPDFG